MRKTLPPRYYLTHFHEFLAFFDGQNAPLLTENAKTFIEQFHQLDADKQCIIARAANRKYAVIDRSQFNYDEINAPQQHIDELIASGWFDTIHHASQEALEGVLTKEAILSFLASMGVVAGVKSLSKSALLARFFEMISHQGWPQELPDHNYLHCAFIEPLKYLLFLHFGHTRGRLNQFSMRDLGVMRTRQDAVNDVARFSSLQEAELAWFYASQRASISLLSSDKLLALATDEFPNTEDVAATVFRDSFLFALGTTLLEAEPTHGLNVLGMATSDKAREKWVRASFKAGNVDEVKEALEGYIDEPPSDTFLAFAEDFYARKYHKKRTSALTDMLRASQHTLLIDESNNQQVERGVMAHYERQGKTCWRTENRLWLSLFGLTFWRLLYEEDALVTEFDRRPMSIKQNNFYQKFEHQIEALLTSFNDKEALANHVRKAAAAHYGKVNSMFMWSSNILDPIQALITYGELPAIITLLRMMARDFASLKDGFPDIMVLDGGLRFEEIKAPGDQLRRNQLVSIQRMQQAGFDVGITAVEWYRDPNQPYVVVDIETTGGNSTNHRITEIGMVKLVAGKVIDTYESLVNPERFIPSSITRLTGISNDMVADAPVFSQIADDIDKFTQDAVFVAHNVNFDYGFIKQEFARLELPFRRPKLCTVREMRKAKPGLSSYSLANLTAHFDITMERHHRALSDARAAAELLNIAFDTVT